ncbi:MAG: ABC transporter permease [Tissierellia bacterium]|nr:ABC transporter permease [Tissierellia bacterium]
MKEKLKKLYITAVLLFMYLPIIVLMVYSFNDSRLKMSWQGFTFKWYGELFRNEEILSSMYYTIIIALGATMIATILGTLAAIGIYYMGHWKRTVFLEINYIPVLNPDIVTAVSLMVLFRLMRLEFGLTSLLLSHIVFTTPYVLLSVLPKLKQMSRALPEAAMDLGATPGTTFFQIILPEIKPGIISGALLAFTLSLDDFVISFFNTGQGIQTLPVTVYSMAKKGINPAINAISTIVFVAILALLLIINKRSDIIEEEV